MSDMLVNIIKLCLKDGCLEYLAEDCATLKGKNSL